MTKIGKIIDVLDDTDRAIVSYLQYDGRMPFTQIADELGITDTLKRVGGSSAGAINALLTGLNYSTTESIAIVKNMTRKVI